MRSSAGLQTLFSDEVNAAPEQCFQVVLEAEVPCDRGSAIESNQDVDVTVITQFVAGRGAEQREPGRTESALDVRAVYGQPAEDLVAVHRDSPRFDAVNDSRAPIPSVTAN